MARTRATAKKCTGGKAPNPAARADMQNMQRELMEERIRRHNEIGRRKCLAAPSTHDLSMSYDPREHKKKMAELDKKFTAREKELLAAAKATVSNKKDKDKGICDSKC